MSLLIAFLIFCFIFAFQRNMYRRHWDRGLLAKLSFDKNHLECGEDATLTLEIENRKLLPLPVFHLKYSVDRSFVFDENENSAVTDLYYKNDAFSILGNQRIIRRHSFHGTKRGVYDIPSCTVHVKDFFLISTFAKQLEQSSLLYVFPKKIRSSEYDELMRGIMGEIAARNSLIEDNMTFRGIRDYTSFDGMRSINWRQSAKRSELMVNLYDHTMDREVRILLNLDTENMIHPTRLLETSISLASSISRDLLKKKTGVSLVTNGMTRKSGRLFDTMENMKSVSFRITEDHVNLPPVGKGSDMSHALTIDKVLSSILASSGKDEFLRLLDAEIKRAEENVFYLIISPYHKADIAERLRRMQQRDIGAAMVVPYYDTLGFNNPRKGMYGLEVMMDED